MPEWIARFSLALGVVASLHAPAPATAQSGQAVVDDAGVVPEGLLRFRVMSSWTRYDSRFTPPATEPLGAPFTTPALGTGQIVGLTTTEDLVRSASAAPFVLSLGQSRLDAVARTEVFPLTAEYGLSDRLSLGVMVPFTRKRATMLFRLDSTASNVGPNPQRFSASAAQTNNALVQSQFATARSDLQAKLASCRASGGADCGPILADTGGVVLLLQQSQDFASALFTLYGGQGSSGQAFVPRTASAAQQAVAMRVTDFNQRYRTYLGVDRLGAVPSASPAPPGSADVQEFLGQDLSADSLFSQERLGVGDIEMGARFKLLDRSRDSTRSVGLTSVVAASLRLPTGSTQSPTSVADLRLGEGRTVLDSRATIDIRAGRLGLLAAGQFAAVVAEKDTAAPRSADVSQAQIQASPRWHVSEVLAIHGVYVLRNFHGGGSDQQAGIGITFSTLSSSRSGSLPIEARFTHLETLSGTPGRPKYVRDQVELRLYFRPR